MYNRFITLEQKHKEAARRREDMAVILSHKEVRPLIPALGLFGATTVALFAAFVLLLTAIDFYPEAPKTIAKEVPAAAIEAEASTTDEVLPEVVEEESTVKTPVVAAHTVDADAPVSVVIDAIGTNVPVLNPVSTDIAALDAALLKGAVHYPGSANLGDSDNMVIFGHSSYLPVVRNQAYKAFNGLQNLNEGNLVRVRSGEEEEVYRVVSVRLAKASADEVIELSTGSKMLTLVTCNTFGEKSDRWVVTAEFVGRYPIAG